MSLSPHKLLRHNRSPETLKRPVIGYRGWYLESGKLRSYNGSFGYWHLGENEAECLWEKFHTGIGIWGMHALYAGPNPRRRPPPEAHDPPGPSLACECGYYAFHSFDKVPGYGNVWGVVLGRGRLAVHSDGWRAQYVKPVVLAYAPHQSVEQVNQLQAIAGEWDVPVVQRDQLEVVAREYGDSVPEELRPGNGPKTTKDPHGIV